jgi:acyl-coenzyme A thioesterase PaaI-like protein
MVLAPRTASTAVRVQFQRACFACGEDNPHGLQLKFHVDPYGAAMASWVPGAQWEVLRGIVHGGIITTLLDEAMAKTVASTGCRTMTAELRVRFRQYAKTGERLQVRGWIVSHKRRLIAVEATLVGADGGERAHSWATFLVLKKPGTVTGSGGELAGRMAGDYQTGE